MKTTPFWRRVAAATATAMLVAIGSLTMAAPASAVTGGYSSQEKAMAKAILDSGRLQGNDGVNSSFLNKNLSGIANGSLRSFTSGATTRVCNVDGRVIAGLYYLVVVKKYTIKVNSSNRWCDFGDASTYSNHYILGGGSGLDIGWFTPSGGTKVTATFANYQSGTAARTAIDRLVKDFFVGAQWSGSPNGDWEVGQGNCRAGVNMTSWANPLSQTTWSETFGDQGYVEHRDTCDHIHVAYDDKDRTYDKPAGCTNCSGFTKVSYPTVMSAAIKATSIGGGTTSPTPTPSPTSPSTSGWGDADWKALAAAIGTPYDGAKFGRGSSVHSSSTGAYSQDAKILQGFLNRYDTYSKTRIEADGYWGKQTTEKLVSFMYAECGWASPPSGAIDGFYSNGNKYSFTTTLANGLASCLDKGNFHLHLKSGWPDSNWAKLHAAISSSTYNSDQFGRASSYTVSHGTTSTSAKRLQSYLNSIDNGTSKDIPSGDIDGIWGPQTTEKLVAVLHDLCGYSSDYDGTLDGKKNGGSSWLPTSGMMDNLASCITKGKFK